jgi:hypothetical protein
VIVPRASQARRRAIGRAAVLLGLSCVFGCGYRPLRNGLAGAPRIDVSSATSSVIASAEAALEEEAATGARAELARHGALARGAPARLVVELVRLDESAEGIAPTETGSRGRGVRLRLIARGVLTEGAARFETADVEATETIASPPDAASWQAIRGAAARGLSRRAGALVAREVLGLP